MSTYGSGLYGAGLYGSGSPDELLHEYALKQLYPVKNGYLGGTYNDDVATEGINFDKAYLAAQTLAQDLFPDTATTLLPSWERVFGLIASGSIATRQAKIISKMRTLVNKSGRLTKAYYLNEAVLLGHPEAYILEGLELAFVVGPGAATKTENFVPSQVNLGPPFSVLDGLDVLWDNAVYQKVVFSSTGTLPAPLVTGLQYTVHATMPGGTTFTVHDQAGNMVAFTDQGSTGATHTMQQWVRGRVPSRLPHAVFSSDISWTWELHATVASGDRAAWEAHFNALKPIDTQLNFFYF